MTQKELKVLQFISRHIHENEPTAEALLFGSRARGDAKPDSDWDIIIIVSTPKVSEHQFNTLNYDLWAKGINMGEQINPIIYTKKQWEEASPTLFRYNVNQDAIKI